MKPQRCSNCHRKMLNGEKTAWFQTKPYCSYCFYQVVRKSNGKSPRSIRRETKQYADRSYVL